MQLEPAAKLQEFMETHSNESVEYLFAQSNDFYHMRSYDEMDEAQDTYFQVYERLVKHLSASFGKPEFVDGMGNSKFPNWYEAMFLSYWKLGNNFVYAALRHEDKELPFLVVYGIHAQTEKIAT